MPKLQSRLLTIILVGLLLLTSGCFQVIKQETSNTLSNPNSVPLSTSQNRFLWMLLGANSGERFGASVALFNDIDGAGNLGIGVGAMAASPSNRNGAGRG